MKPHQAFIVAFVASFLACLPLAMVTPALAQAAQAGVDFTPLAMNAITVFGTIAVAAAGVLGKFLISFLSAKTGVHNAQLENLMADRFNVGVQNAINYATTVSKAWISDPNHKQFTTIEFGNSFVDLTVGYIIQHYAESITFFKLTPEKIEDIVRSRMAPLLGQPIPNGGMIPTVDTVPFVPSAPVAPVTSAPTTIG